MLTKKIITVLVFACSSPKLSLNNETVLLCKEKIINYIVRGCNNTAESINNNN